MVNSLCLFGEGAKHEIWHMCRNKLFSHRVSGLRRERTREQPDIQLKAPSWYPTSTTRSHLIKFPHPSEDWVSNTWMPVQNISHGTLDITWPNMFIDILGSWCCRMIHAEIAWALPCLVFSVLFPTLAGELFSDMILMSRPHPVESPLKMEKEAVTHEI